MSADRPTIPAQIRREVVVEAGDRCAITTCRQVPIEVHHIDQDRTNNAFENLIALCSNCHARVTKGEIPEAHVRLYKANLSLISLRYGDLERRVIDAFVAEPYGTCVTLPTELTVLMSYLVNDGIVDIHVPANEQHVERVPSYRDYWLTEAGRAFVERLREGRAIE